MKAGFFLLFLIFIYQGFAQITTSPVLPVASQKVTITFDSSKESRLGYFTGDLYTHTGVILEGNSAWQHVIGMWGDNTKQPKLINKGSGIYELEISPDINSFYSVVGGEKVVKIAFVFRSSDGTKQTNDLLVTVYEEGLFVSISSPAGSAILGMNEPVALTAFSSTDAALRLKVNGNVIAETSGKNISADYSFTSGGWNRIIAEAVVGTTAVYDTAEVYIRGNVVEATKPASFRKGINYPSENSAALVLWAPEKKFVYVLGDFNNWELDENFQMKKDGDYFWLEIKNLEKGKEYIFQYFIDGEIRIADPYTEKTSDPWNDSYISSSTYPGLISYPQGETDGIASVLQPGQEPYVWEVSGFLPPAKEKMVIYELLVRDFTSEHTFRAVTEKLDYLKDLRFNVLELMPVNEFEGNSSWGYNPSFYFAPDKYYGPKNELKKLVDECHKRGIAVVIDLVLNHSYGQSPFVKMYWDDINNRPAANNPWYNVQHNFQNPDAQWGYDFNHESTATRELVDSINSFWMAEYKIDGFRFDFTKGFSNTSWGSTSWGSSYDSKRIANLKRMSDEIWKRRPEAIIIFEHLAENTEEKELAEHGILLWGNMSGNYGNAAKGVHQNSSSELKGAVFSERGWAEPNLVAYQESHDEERIIYKCLTGGNTLGSYNIKQLPTALARAGLNDVFFIPLPGPKMIWQMGELGYDYSIDYNGRLGEKPVVWDYTGDTNRTALFRVMAKLNFLKANYEEFSSHDIQYNLTNEIKTYRMGSAGKYVVAAGNFGLVNFNTTVTFPETGTWYEYFSNTTLNVASASQTLSLAPGEYRLYSLRQFEVPHVVTETQVIPAGGAGFSVYPNPAAGEVTLLSDTPFSETEIYSITGEKVFGQKDAPEYKKNIDVGGLLPGIYFVKISENQLNLVRKIIIR